MEYLIIFLFLSAMYLVQKEINKLRGNYDGKIEELSHDISDLREKINELRHEAEYQNLTESEMEEVAFENAQDISIIFFEALKKGQIVSFISGSYYYPDENIHISSFEYKHDYIDKESKSEYGWDVHGYEKYFEGDEWTPCTLLANEAESSTLSCSGTVKKK
jgi:hypothetical protein